MTAAEHRDRHTELTRRVLEETGLGRPVPFVTVAVARLISDLLAELGLCVLELELAAERAGAAS